ncbi:MAG: phosphonate C-P lyase system protein PhnH [Syntrophobacteraceae bacterium]
MPAANDSKAIQRAFRILLQAMAHPGEIHLLSPDAPDRGLPLVAQTLLDHEVGFAVLGPDSESLSSSLKDLTRSRLIDISAADFVIVAGGDSRGGRIAAIPRSNCVEAF